jgi:hypothetical protein
VPTVTRSILSLSTGERAFSPNFGGELVVIGRSWPAGTTLEQIDDGLEAVEALLTADGRGWYPQWHVGPASGTAVYVERHDVNGCAMHGWIDGESRRLVQVG